MDHILRLNLTAMTVSAEPFPKEWTFIGGRSLSAKVLLKEVDPQCDPLGPSNKLVFAPGVLSGSSAPTSGRMSVGAKSPLTGGIKEANSGGQAGQKLMRLGYRALIVEGQAHNPEKCYLLFISRNRLEIQECSELKGKRTYAVSEALAERSSDRAAFVICGPAGELCLTGASIAFSDASHRHPSRHAARGGLGAVMGAKGLKAIVVDDEGTQARVAINAEEFKKFAKQFSKEYKAGPQPLKHGTAVYAPIANAMNTLPTRNRREMQFKGVGNIDGNIIQANYSIRGGRQHNCMTGCIVQCSNTVNDANGNYVTSALEFETVAQCGSNCAIEDLDKLAQIDRLCDELGLDTIETGGAIGMAMDSGAIAFGDADAVIAMLERVDKNDALSSIIANGVVSVAKHFGMERVPAVRGQGLPAWEPRTLNAAGITYATSAMGCDHTAGLVIEPHSDPVRHSQELQLVNALCDSSGFCQFQKPSIDDMRILYNALLGSALTFEDMADLGWQCLADEWAFNQQAGFTLDDYDLPEWLRTEAVPSNGAVFAVPKEQLHRVFKRLPISDELRAMKADG